MTEKLVVEASGSLHLMINGERVSANFVNEEGTPHTTMILVTDMPPPDEDLPGEISKYNEVKLKVTLEYGGRQYSAALTDSNVLTLRK